MANPPDIFRPIDPLRFWVQKVLPLVYDDSLSYYEVLAKMGDKLNELIEIVNVQGEGIYGYIDQQMEAYRAQINAETDAKIQALTNTIIQNNQAINARLDTFQNDYTQKINAVEGNLEAQIAALTQTLNQRVAELNVKIAQTGQDAINLDSENRKWTLTQIQLAIDNLPKDLPAIIDPSDGQLEDVQTVINHIWNFLNTNALTADEYDALDLTAQEYDDKGLTATQYDQTGKLLLVGVN